ncbi:hypothetical protein ES703_61581 [subsurface metagenome]
MDERIPIKCGDAIVIFHFHQDDFEPKPAIATQRGNPTVVELSPDQPPPPPTTLKMSCTCEEWEEYHFCEHALDVFKSDCGPFTSDIRDKIYRARQLLLRAATGIGEAIHWTAGREERQSGDIAPNKIVRDKRDIGRRLGEIWMSGR